LKNFEAEPERQLAALAEVCREHDEAERRSQQQTEEREARQKEQEAKARKRAVKTDKKAAAARAYLEEQREMKHRLLCCEQQVVDRHRAEAARAAEWQKRRRDAKTAEILDTIVDAVASSVAKMFDETISEVVGTKPVSREERYEIY
jgi:hypothetical protein